MSKGHIDALNCEENISFFAKNFCITSLNMGIYGGRTLPITCTFSFILSLLYNIFYKSSYILKKKCIHLKINAYNKYIITSLVRISFSGGTDITLNVRPLNTCMFLFNCIRQSYSSYMMLYTILKLIKYLKQIDFTSFTCKSDKKNTFNNKNCSEMTVFRPFLSN